MEYDDDCSSTDGSNDIDVTCCYQAQPITTMILADPFTYNSKSKKNLNEYNDIFSSNVKGKAMYVPPMKFSINVDQWESNPNRLPSRHISVEKQHKALTKVMDDLQELQVMPPSKATT